MNDSLKIIPLLLLFLSAIISAQPSFEVISLTGTAKVQHSDKKVWEKLTSESKLFDNDLVETYFQTKLILGFGEKNITILGPNSKALLNISQNSAEKSKLNVNLTLFGGGLFTKAISGCHINIYTANAVGELDSGSVSTIADGKSGETGFQSMSGSIYVRNIAQQKGIDLRSGLTTMIIPNKEPTAPLYITHRHVAVLKQFFGDGYIQAEMATSGIEPTEERGTRSRLALSQNLSGKEATKADQGMYKAQFSPEKVYGIILSEREQKYSFYSPLSSPSKGGSNKFNLQFLTDLGIPPDGVRTAYQINPSIRFPAFSAALRFSFAQNLTSKMNTGFDSREGILDKFENITLGKDSLFLHAGTLEDYTLGYGLIVNRFSNSNPNSIFHPMGLNCQLSLSDLKFKAFISDVTLPLIGGAYLELEPSIYKIGLGYYYDANQFRFSSDSATARYGVMSKPENSIPDPDINTSNAHIFELDFTSDIVSTYNFNMAVAFQYAQKFLQGNDGIVLKMPVFIMNLNKTRLGLGFVSESGRLLTDLFGSSYISNRYRLKNDTNALSPVDTIITPQSYLSKDRKAIGIDLSYSVNPFKGVDLSINYKQDFIGRHSINIAQSDSTGDSSTTIPTDFSYYVSCKINDSLLSLIKFAEIYIQQYHGSLIPQKGSFFASWLFEAGFHLLTKPLFLNTSFEAGGKFWYIDSGPDFNNKIDSEDMIFEVYAGLQWGFL